MKQKLLLLTSFIIMSLSLVAQNQTDNIPHLIVKDGRHQLVVDGEPFLVLGAQCNNSSAWPATLPKVWSAMDAVGANTLEIPIYWEQFEPEEGKYDYSVVDMIITQARERNYRLVLLWFATWKNGSNHYMPQWMKLQPEKYPNMINKNGEQIDSPSPHSENTFNADIKAFTAFMQHLKDFDKQHTVIMVQIENEPGTWGSVRDYSKKANKIFNNPVDDKILTSLKIKPKTNKNWADVFGRDADEFFHVWHVAEYIGKIAKAGKAIYPLPMYVNAALRNPFNTSYPPNYQVGGPNANVFHLWKAAAPDIDFLAPDIYFSDSKSYLKILELYSRANNALMVPETMWHNDFPKYFYSALGNGAIGYAPFGLDDVRTRYDKKGNIMTAKEMYEPTALNFRLFKPMANEIAKLNFEGKIKTAVQLEVSTEMGNTFDQKNYITDTTLVFKGWDVNIAFGTFSRMARTETQPDFPDGRIMVAELGKSQFLLAGYHARVMFKPNSKNKDKFWSYLKVEEGHYKDGEFIVERILNGDQTDWGLQFAEPRVLRVSIYLRR